LVFTTKGLSFLAATFSPDGGFLLAQDRGGDAVLWDAATGDPGWRRGEPDHDGPDPELRRLFGPRPENVNLDQILGERQARTFFGRILRATSPDGCQTAVALDGGVIVCDDDPCSSRRLQEGLGEIEAMAYTPDG